MSRINLKTVLSCAVVLCAGGLPSAWGQTYGVQQGRGVSSSASPTRGGVGTSSTMFSNSNDTKEVTSRRTMGRVSDPAQLRTGSGMVGSNDPASQRMVGANGAGGNQVSRGNNNNNRRNNNNGNFGQNFANMMQQMNQNGQGNGMGANRSKPPLQPQFRVGPEMRPAYQPQVVTNDLKKVLANDMKDKVYVKNMNFDSHPDGLVVMRGEVATEQQRRMAELMVRLEPGVKKIENQLTVNPAAAK